MNLIIVKIIGGAILFSVIGALILAGMGKTSPEWVGHAIDVGIGALAGLVVGGTAVAKKEDSNEQDS